MADKFKDLYLLLGAQEEASLDELNRAWKSQMKKCHPDRNFGNPEYWEARCKEINAAYETLKDSNRRAVFDQLRKEFYAKEYREKMARERAILKISSRRKKREEELENHLREIKEKQFQDKGVLVEKEKTTVAPESVPVAENPTTEENPTEGKKRFSVLKIILPVLLLLCGLCVFFYNYRPITAEIRTEEKLDLAGKSVDLQKSVPVAKSPPNIASFNKPEKPEIKSKNIDDSVPAKVETSNINADATDSSRKVVPNITVVDVDGDTRIDSKIFEAERAEKESLITSSRGNTPFQYMRELGSVGYVKLLLKKGSNPNLKNEDGILHLEIVSADNANDEEIINLLFTPTKKSVPEKTLQTEIQEEPKEKNSTKPDVLEVEPIVPEVSATPSVPAVEEKFCYFGKEIEDEKTPRIKGIYYDLKEKNNGNAFKIKNDLKEEQSNYLKIGRSFVRGGWSISKFRPYMKAPKTLSVEQIFIPRPALPNANDVPGFFGLSGKKGDRSYIVYSGVVVPNKSGKIRFVGAGDDILCVRFNRKNALDNGYDLMTENSELHLGFSEIKVLGESEALRTFQGFSGVKFRSGPWIRVRSGMRYNIDILIGETTGLHFYAALLFEVEDKKSNIQGARPILMRFGDSELPKEITTGPWVSEIDTTGGGWVFKPVR